MRAGGVILCGGKSSRMGLPKATLPFGPELMLQRVVRILAEVVDAIVVVRAAGQELPPLPADVIVTEDRRASRGPLEGMQAGFLAARGVVDTVFATSCDAPLLKPAFVRHLLDLQNDYQIVVPVQGKFHFPLAAVYETKLTDTIASQLDADQLRPRALYDLVKTLQVPTAELETIDPGLESLQNLNHADEYLTALRRAGFEAPAEVVQQLAERSG